MKAKPPFHNLGRIGLQLSSFLGWNRSSICLMSAIAGIMSLVILIWFPLVLDYFSQWNLNRSFVEQVDWLLVFDFMVMFLLIMAKADLRSDSLVMLVGLGGGFVIETWGTQTHLWTYYTLESPPLWIMPAWPVATLAIERIFGVLNHWTRSWSSRIFEGAYWPLFLSFFGLMLLFVRPTLDAPLTILALMLVAILILRPGDKRTAVLACIAGAGLGYFLELWGTTRACWVYHTFQSPPPFAVLAHGMAAVAFMRLTAVLRSLELPTRIRRNAAIQQ